MAKGADAFRSIGEVAKLIGVAPHVLRYWETQFSLLKPMKRGDGRRYYRPDDVRLAAGICEILRDEGLTIRGAKKMLARDRGETVRRRGAIKLGEAIEADEQPVAEPLEPLTATPAKTPADNDLALQDSVEAEEPAHAPRARARKRPAPRAPGSLPLFPDDPVETPRTAPAAKPQAAPVDASQSAWLAALVQAGAALRGQPGGKLSEPAGQAARRLLDAIADHY